LQEISKILEIGIEIILGLSFAWDYNVKQRQGEREREREREMEKDSFRKGFYVGFMRV
jgi:hypothetical protein